MTGALAVQARDVAFSYGDRAALNGIDFEVPSGSVHGFLGPNGSGKSTLFKLLATILPLQRGEVSVLGSDLRRDAAELRARLGVVFQSPALDKKLTVRENLVYGGHLYGLSGAELATRVDEMLEQSALRDRASDIVGELSGGLRRRVELGKGLLHRPDLVLLDEPSTGLDPSARQELWRFLRGREGVTVLFTTHLMDEAQNADALTLFDRGRVVAAGTPQELAASIGGEVLELTTADAERLGEAVRTEHGIEPVVLSGSVRIEHETAHRLVAELMSAHGDAIEKLTLSHPSLEDVFIRKTGHRFEGEE